MDPIVFGGGINRVNTCVANTWRGWVWGWLLPSGSLGWVHSKRWACRFYFQCISIDIIIHQGAPIIWTRDIVKEIEKILLQFTGLLAGEQAKLKLHVLTCASVSYILGTMYVLGVSTELCTLGASSIVYETNQKCLLHRLPFM